MVSVPDRSVECWLSLQEKHICGIKKVFYLAKLGQKLTFIRVGGRAFTPDLRSTAPNPGNTAPGPRRAFTQSLITNQTKFFLQMRQVHYFVRGFTVIFSSPFFLFLLCIYYILKIFKNLFLFFFSFSKASLPYK